MILIENIAVLINQCNFLLSQPHTLAAAGGGGGGGIIEDEPHYRIGWASRLAELEGPLGYDKFGFAYRSKAGTVLCCGVSVVCYAIFPCLICTCVTCCAMLCFALLCFAILSLWHIM